MKKYQELSSSVLQGVGGKENVTNLYHCMTRLRFVLSDKTKVNEDALKATKGVLGINWDKSGELQVIIGTDVDNVYKALLEDTGLQETDKIDENLDKQPLSVRGVLDGIVNAFSACMNPLVPMFVLVGTFKPYFGYGLGLALHRSQQCRNPSDREVQMAGQREPAYLFQSGSGIHENHPGKLG